MNMPNTPGSLVVSQTGSSFMLSLSGLWLDMKGSHYALPLEMPEKWRLIYDAGSREAHLNLRQELAVSSA